MAINLHPSIDKGVRAGAKKFKGAPDRKGR
jgi:hypothetical protein